MDEEQLLETYPESYQNPNQDLNLTNKEIIDKDLLDQTLFFGKSGLTNYSSEASLDYLYGGKRMLSVFKRASLILNKIKR